MYENGSENCEERDEGALCWDVHDDSYERQYDHEDHERASRNQGKAKREKREKREIKIFYAYYLRRNTVFFILRIRKILLLRLLSYRTS